MSAEGGGLIKEVINTISGNLANDAVDYVQRKIQSSTPVRKLRERFQKDAMHKDAKAL